MDEWDGVLTRFETFVSGVRGVRRKEDSIKSVRSIQCKGEERGLTSKRRPIWNLTNSVSISRPGCRTHPTQGPRLTKFSLFHSDSGENRFYDLKIITGGFKFNRNNRWYSVTTEYDLTDSWFWDFSKVYSTKCRCRCRRTRSQSKTMDSRLEL